MIWHQKMSSEKGLLAALVSVAFIVFLAKLNVANLYQINWDEFYFLSKVYEYLRGDLSQVLQTYYVHFFTWLPLVSDNEAEQIVAARFVMVVFQGLTGLCLYRIGRHYFHRSSSLFAVLAYFSVSYVLFLGADFRADPIAGFFSVAAVDLLHGIKRGWMYPVGAAVSMAIALLVTIKSAYYLAVLGLLFFVAYFESGRNIRVLGCAIFAACVGILVLGILYWFHQDSIGAVSKESGAVLSGAYKKVIASQAFFPRWSFFLESIKKDGLYWVLWVAGFALLLREVYLPKLLGRAQSCALLVMSLPLLTFLFYRNAFPYFYAFILATPSLLIGLAWERLVFAGVKWGRLTAKALLALVAFVVLFMGTVTPYKKNMHAQYEMLSVIHQLFPEPVSYIDRCSMVSSYKKEGFFMSTWGTENYRDANEAVFAKIIENSEPKFLLANKQQLNISIPDEIRRRVFHGKYELLKEDLKVLRDNYIPHWGSLYVAGKYIEVKEPEVAYDLNVLIEGNYTFEAAVSAKLNGEELRPGSIVYLKKGIHKFSSEKSALYVFRWGRYLPKPQSPPMRDFLFAGF